MKAFAVIGALGVLIASQAHALEPSWPDLREELYGGQFLVETGDTISIDAPYRSEMDSRTRIGATVTAPDGETLDSVTVILDENPMPVSAVFRFARPVSSFFFDITMRVNGPTPLHVVARTVRGQLFVADSFVKTSGQGACSAPPGTDPELALATLGDMTVEVQQLSDRPPLLQTALSGSAAAGLDNAKRMDLAVQHPSHSGMQMNQITLLYIPARYIDTIAVDLDGAPFVGITGSISLSENPEIRLSIPTSAQSIDVTLTDTGGTRTTKHRSLPGF
ncbi:quinoprotein dehydrogenase-associated SoxYZ-like carrier [Hoeflea ulvae]|uniref:Quinoprotein dehydrogenase-associated SoxYZ-like carrier n=1 Tax=Hoeflea ulvae TaxID=2983764 RepID=A0ABT3YL66_9HYPH|nr:quinoprotein dehydrogenase-associated SoxYZ-like carrier [Hoeflea ulvae]MCY0096509.1 quinoprotein dehydrogenase-associated SoxYZ-like carrier [Hoeflea ulvae]